MTAYKLMLNIANPNECTVVVAQLECLSDVTNKYEDIISCCHVRVVNFYSYDFVRKTLVLIDIPDTIRSRPLITRKGLPPITFTQSGEYETDDRDEGFHAFTTITAKDFDVYYEYFQSQAKLQNSLKQMQQSYG